MDDSLLEPFRRLLEDVSTPEAVRAAERTAGVAPVWRDLEESGFLDALVPEAQGGAGLSLADVYPLVAATGEYAVPAPFAETMVARGLIAGQGAEPPAEAVIVLAPPSAVLPLAGAATHALVPRGDALVLLPTRPLDPDPFRAGAGTVDEGAAPVLSIKATGVDLPAAAAALTAAKLAGAMSRVLAMSLRYAEERQQFGRSLGKFQAIQHQLAVLSEQVVSANVAARIGMSGDGFDPLRAAVAKSRTSEASHLVCNIAHAVHGAIGATEEYDLQLYTRRIKQWQMAFGSESFWARRLADAFLAGQQGAADFVRLNLQDAE